MSPLAFLTGALFGGVHVFSGPDHLAAIAPIASRGERRSWLTGLRWGVGHSSGVALVACAALVLRDLLPLDALSGWSERAVGVVLIGLGLWGFYRSMGRGVEAREHDHGERDARRRTHGRAAFAIGTLHGLAGSSHLLGVLPALAQPTRADAMVYLAGFALGTIAAMAAFAAAVAWLARDLRMRGRSLQRPLCGVTSAAAVGVGVWWLAIAG
jgi:cytochrome c biogenesis protein CcdA